EVKIGAEILGRGHPFADRDVPHPSLTLPGGAIGDYLPHLAALAHGFVGPHRAVRAHWSKRSPDSPLPCDPFRGVVARARGTAYLSFIAHAEPETFVVRVSGTRMRATADLFDMTLVLNRLGGGPRPIARLRDRLREARDIRRAVRGAFLKKFAA